VDGCGREEENDRPWSAGADVNYDPSDSNAVIRRLVHVNEELKRKMKRMKKNVFYTKDDVSNDNDVEGEEIEESVDLLRREIKMMRIENNNVYMLRKENIDLRQKNEQLEKRLKANHYNSRSNSSSSTFQNISKSTKGISLSEAVVQQSNQTTNISTSISHRLWDENARLKKELASANTLIGKLHSQLQVASTASNTDTFSKFLTNDDVMDAGDAEIAALIQRNAQNLQEIRKLRYAMCTFIVFFLLF
jgi:hypothetical protein